MQNNNNSASAEHSYPNPKYAWYVVVILFVAFTISYVDRQIISLLIGPIKEDLGLSDSQIGLLQGFAFTMIYTLTGIPLGLLADRKSRKVIIAIGMFFWSVMTALHGVARSFGMLFLARAGVGIGEAGLSPAANSMIADYFPKEKRSKPIALYFMGVYVGVGMSFILGGLVVDIVTNAGEIILPVLGEIRPWEMTYFIVSLPGLLLVVVVLLTVKEPFRHGRVSPDGTKVDAGLSAARDFFRQHFKAYAIIFLGFGIAGSMAIGFFAWTTALFTRLYGWEASQVGYSFGTIVMVMGTLGIIVGGAIADRLLQKGQQHAHIKVAIWAIIGATVFASIAAVAGSPWLTLALLCPAVACFGMPVALAPAAVNHITPNQFRGQAIAIYVFVVGLINNNLGPQTPAFLNDFVFGDELAIGKSLMTMTIVYGILSTLILLWSVKSYTRSANELLMVE